MTLTFWLLAGGLLAYAATNAIRRSRTRSKSFTTDQLSGDWLAQSEIPRGSAVVSERRAFGERARRQRERRGVTLETIAHSTKVPASLFAGLERGDCSRWPAGLYSRAYVRAYAELIGLDPTEAVEDFTAAFGETVWPDGAPTRRRMTSAADLRLSMDDQPDLRHKRTLRRVTIALADLVLAAVPSSGSPTPFSRHRSGRPSAWPSLTRLAEGCSPTKRSSAGRSKSCAAHPRSL